MSRKIYLNPGHGGSDSGAASLGRKEKDDVLRLCLRVKEILSAQDCKVRLSREKDVDATIKEACADANNWGADYFLSVHRNTASPDATGNEIWIYSKGNDAAVRKADTILSAVNKATGLKNRGVKRGAVSYTDFGVNKYTNMYSSLLELGFITNRKDNDALDKNFESLALALAKALLGVVGSEYKELERKKGDVNGDGKITAEDAREALRGAAKIENLNEAEKRAADMNSDGNVTAQDAREILRKAAKLE